MKILLCILTGQHIPNLLSVHHFKPDKLVLIESDYMKNEKASQNFLDALEIGGIDFTLDERRHVLPLDAEDNLESVQKCLESVYGRYPGDEWIVNLNGGKKPMAIATYEFFNGKGARLVYIDFQNPRLILGLDGHPAETCEHRPTLQEFLAGYGFKSTKREKDIADAEERAKSRWECARIIALKCPDQLLNLGDLGECEIKKKWDEARKEGMALTSGQLSPNDDELCNTLSSSFGLKNESGSLVGEVDKYAVDFLTGAWLEVFVWGLLDRHSEELGIWDVRLGLKPGKIDSNTDSDFDVAFMHAHALTMVECKSGSQKHDPGAEVLHKIEAVVRQFRALRIRSCLATTSSNVLGQDGKIKPGLVNRSKIYQCRILIRDDIRELAKNADSPELVRKLLLGESGKPS